MAWTRFASASGLANAYLPRRVVWNVAAFKGRAARFRVVDEARGECARTQPCPAQECHCQAMQPEHVNADDFRCANVAPPGTEWQRGRRGRDRLVGSVYRAMPLWGTTDAHAHFVTNLNMGGHVYWADPSDSLENVYDCSLPLPAITDRNGDPVRPAIPLSSERLQCHVRADVVAILTTTLWSTCTAAGLALHAVPIVGWAIGQAFMHTCHVAALVVASDLLTTPALEGRTYHGAYMPTSGGFSFLSYFAGPLRQIMDAVGLDEEGWLVSQEGVIEGLDWDQDNGRHSGHTLKNTHQQYHHEMIRRAYQGGLRLMVVDASNGRLMKQFMDGDDTFDDWDSLVTTVEGVKRLTATGLEPGGRYDPGPLADIAEIAYTPAQARDIVRRNKLALILGSEVQELGKARFAGDSVEQQVQDLYAMGIRKVTPVHGIDNPLGGTAFFNDIYNINAQYANVTKDESGTDADLVMAPFFPALPFFLPPALPAPFGGLVIGPWSVGRSFGADMPCDPSATEELTACLPWNLHNHGWFRAAITRETEDDWIGETDKITFRVGFYLAGRPLKPFSVGGAGLIWDDPKLPQPIKLNNLGWLIGAAPGGVIPGRCSLEGMMLPLPLGLPDAVKENYRVPSHMNALGLLPAGEQFISEMMRQGMLVDMDHLGQRTRLGVFALSRAFGGEAHGQPGAAETDYPLFNIHTKLRGYDKDGPVPHEYRDQYGYTSEIFRTMPELDRIRQSGGTISPLAGAYFIDPAVPDLPSEVNHDCDFSSKNFAMKYLRMMRQMAGKGITPSLDMNGFANAMVSRYGTGRSCHMRPKPDRNQLADWRRDWHSSVAAACETNSLNPEGSWIPSCPSTTNVLNQLAESSGVVYGDYATRRHWTVGVPWLPPGRPDLRVVVAREAFERRDDGTPRTAQVEYVSYGAARQLRPMIKWKTAGAGADAANTGWDFNLDGLAHIGLYPDFFQDLRNVGVTFEQLGPLFNAAEDLIQMWERSCRTANAWRARNGLAPLPGCDA